MPFGFGWQYRVNRSAAGEPYSSGMSSRPFGGPFIPRTGVLPGHMQRVITAKSTVHAARAYWTAGRPDNARAFRAARRHSRLVRVLRVTVPVVVVGSLASTVLATYLNPLRMLPNMPSVDNVVISGSKITMEKPRVSGYTQDGRAYDMSAVAARQDLTKPD